MECKQKQERKLDFIHSTNTQIKKKNHILCIPQTT